MSLNDFLGEYLDPGFQQHLKLVDKVLEDNKVLEMVLEWQKQYKVERGYKNEME